MPVALITTKTLARIREMNQAGMNDCVIAQELGLSKSIIQRWRKRMGLEPVRLWAKRPLYTVYLRKTGEYICEGTSEECAAQMGIKVETFYQQRSRKNRIGKHEIFEV